MSIEEKIIHIKELDPELIPPSTAKFKDSTQGGSKIVVIGKPGTGKSTLLASLLYAKRHIFPTGLIVSGTEDSNSYYSKIFPDTFIYNKYEPEIIENFIKRQKLAK